MDKIGGERNYGKKRKKEQTSFMNDRIFSMHNKIRIKVKFKLLFVQKKIGFVSKGNAIFHFCHV